MWWPRLYKAFDQFRKWAAIKTLLELAGVWKWIVLGASVMGGFLLPSFSKFDPALRVLVVLFTVALALAATLFAAALRKVIKAESPETLVDGQVVTSDKPKTYQVVIAALLVLLAVVGAIWGPHKSLVDSPVSVRPTPVSVPICSPPQNATVLADLPNDATKKQREAYRRDLIRSWRSMISTIASACPAETFNDAQVSAATQRHPGFQTLRLYLSQEAGSQLARTTHFYYGAKIQSVLITLEMDVDRIEKRWKEEAARTVASGGKKQSPSKPSERETATELDEARFVVSNAWSIHSDVTQVSSSHYNYTFTISKATFIPPILQPPAVRIYFDRAFTNEDKVTSTSSFPTVLGDHLTIKIYSDFGIIKPLSVNVDAYAPLNLVTIKDLVVP